MLYEYWFARIHGISANKKRNLREYFGDGKAIYNIEEIRIQETGILNEKERKILVHAKREKNI